MPRREVALPEGGSVEMEVSERLPGDPARTVETYRQRSKRTRAVVCDGTVFWDVLAACARLNRRHAAEEAVAACDRASRGGSGLALGHEWRWLDEWLLEEVGKAR